MDIFLKRVHKLCFFGYVFQICPKYGHIESLNLAPAKLLLERLVESSCPGDRPERLSSDMSSVVLTKEETLKCEGWKDGHAANFDSAIYNPKSAIE